ncbi:hypothetical protein Ais01nite_28460 [Asanoa ishikariensis]|uniref:Uncharacterized protein n=1 Tax=Asanoa ishikariensis TaxID=137265 RepID=A0A1H3QRQ4_9ACTN|nr:hypothetical protein [Asanoa ishikariensis]GIF64811.1 hypothetical protein Ais01nite_28460 [Asanoa ishikariensis]SDZ15389.1 hypothetical protein SAMN05421684_3075 [Asanoa ishikariensis]
MDARPLKDVFTDLVGDPSANAAALAGAGHDLPPDLVAEAVVSFAGSAPAEVAEHLAPFVTAHSGVPVESELEEPAGWAELLATAPEPGTELDDDVPLDVPQGDHPGVGELAFGSGDTSGQTPDLDLDTDPGGDLDDEPVAVGGGPSEYPDDLADDTEGFTDLDAADNSDDGDDADEPDELDG